MINPFSESDALRILAYLTASADTQLFEPDIYGPFRMVEAASQLAAACSRATRARIARSGRTSERS